MNIPAWAQRSYPPVPLATQRHPDYCSCFKPAGCWGDHGFHWRLYGDRDVEREVDRALGSLPEGSDDSVRRSVEEEAKRFASNYAGLHLAYERCPAAQAAIADEIVAQKAKRPRNGRRRQPELVTGLDSEQPTKRGGR